MNRETQEGTSGIGICSEHHGPGHPHPESADPEGLAFPSALSGEARTVRDHQAQGQSLGSGPSRAPSDQVTPSPPASAQALVGPT